MSALTMRPVHPGLLWSRARAKIDGSFWGSAVGLITLCTRHSAYLAYFASGSVVSQPQVG